MQIQLGLSQFNNLSLLKLSLYSINLFYSHFQIFIDIFNFQVHLFIEVIKLFVNYTCPNKDLFKILDILYYF